MPELPEVETVVRGLREPLADRTILTAIFPEPPRRMTNIAAEDFARGIANQPIRSISRRAKYLVFTLADRTLIVHLKMTGHLYVVPKDTESNFDRWLRVKFSLDNGTELRFSDARRFGRVYLVNRPDEILPKLGPEPLDDAFTLEVFRKQIKGRKGVLKSLLLNQAFVAGVGNIYADEALHIARLHPLRTADSLNSAEVKRLYHAIQQALNEGLHYQGASIGWYRKPDGTRGELQHHLRVYRTRSDQDRPCPDCGTPITTIRVGQRGTHFCPTCQTL